MNAPLAKVIAAKRAQPYDPSKSVETLRAEYAGSANAIPLPSGTSYEAVEANAVPAEWIDAPGAAADQVFLFVHGGGYYRGSVADTRATAARISAATAMRCLSVDYRLAPEHPFPAAIDDTHAAYRFLLEAGFAANRLVVGGVSAGGGLTLALLLAARAAGDPLPAAAVPMSPWTDLCQSGASFATKHDVDPSISKLYLDRMAGYYLNGADPRDPLASPIYGDLRGLPPLLIQVGTSETLLDDSRDFTTRARAEGCTVVLEEWPEMIHGWQQLAHVLPEGQAAIDRIGEFVRAQVG